jgi:hypothetical protein
MGLCWRCGQQVIAGMAFCGRCGAPVTPEAAPQPAAPEFPAPLFPAPEHQGAAAPAGRPDGFGPQPPRFARRLPFAGRDLRRWVRGGAILLGVAVAAGFVLALLIGLFLPSANHGDAADWFSVGFLLAGMALGARVGASASVGIESGPGSILTGQTDGRISVLLVTAAVLLTARWLARRAQGREPSSSLKNLTVDSLGSGLVFSLGMAILALVVHIRAFYDWPIGEGGQGSTGFVTAIAGLLPAGSGSAYSLSARSMFLWPLLLVVLVWWGSAFALWFRAGAVSGTNRTAAGLAWLWTCRPAFLAVRAQILVTMVLGGVGVYVYEVVRTLQNSSPGTGSGDTARVVLGLLLGLPNLAALAGSVALGVSITGLAPLNQQTSQTSTDAGSGFSSSSLISTGPADDSIGFFGGQHPTILYALIIASVLGAVLAARWAVGKSWDRSRALLGPGQAWRGAVLGALLWPAIGLAAQMSLSLTADGFGDSLLIGPSLTGLLLAGAIWGLLAGLALSFFAGRLRAVPVPVFAPAPTPASSALSPTAWSAAPGQTLWAGPVVPASPVAPGGQALRVLPVPESLPPPVAPSPEESPLVEQAIEQAADPSSEVVATGLVIELAPPEPDEE